MVLRLLETSIFIVNSSLGGLPAKAKGSHLPWFWLTKAHELHLPKASSFKASDSHLLPFSCFK